jgi:hypothetical protein
MRTQWVLAGAVALLALTSSPVLAQGRGRGRDKGKSEPPGQVKKAERSEQREARFGDHDRQIARNWYEHERHGPHAARELPPGLRDRDRLPPGIERRLQRGWVVDQAERGRLYPPPPMLVRGLAPAPPGYRYFLFGGHLILVDPGYRVFDTIRLELNLRL